jgi:hypothetical protein
MRNLPRLLVMMVLATGCTVPDLEELLAEKPRACSAEHPCAEGYSCVANECVESSCADTKWYPDADRDGFGDRDATPIVKCTEPPGPPAYVRNGLDCRDSDPQVFPRTEVSEARCNNVDDDCDGAVDEGFTVKGLPCSDPCPGGQYVCNASQDGLTCGNAPAKLSLYADEDGDGAGRDSGDSTGSVCPGEPIPPGAVANADDCNDDDPNNRRGRSEVCDGRDNTCDTQADEGGICAGKGWKVLGDPALTGSRQWKTVAIGPSGLPVWVAGDGGALAVRTQEGQPFRSLDGACGNYHWLTAWVRPTDGSVFLGSDLGQLAQHDGTACVNQAVNASSFAITGIMGFPPAVSPTLYVVNSTARLSTWVVGSSPQEQYNLNPESYTGIHALEPSLLLGVGGTEESISRPHVASYAGTGIAVQRHTLVGIPAGYNGSLRAVWMGGLNLAYAVGDGGLVVKWDGSTIWTRVLPPADNPAANFTSVVVLDPSSIYSTDANGIIRRLTTSGWISTPLYTVNQNLRDLAASSPGDIWAVGDNGVVVHFPE